MHPSLLSLSAYVSRIYLHPCCPLVLSLACSVGDIILTSTCGYFMWDTPCRGAVAGAAGTARLFHLQPLGSARLGNTRIQASGSALCWCLVCLGMHRDTSGVVSSASHPIQLGAAPAQVQFSCYTASKLAPEVAVVLQA